MHIERIVSALDSMQYRLICVISKVWDETDLFASNTRLVAFKTPSRDPLTTRVTAAVCGFHGLPVFFCNILVQCTHFRLFIQLIEHQVREIPSSFLIATS